jgi:hypothetical protein
MGPSDLKSGRFRTICVAFELYLPVAPTRGPRGIDNIAILGSMPKALLNRYKVMK